VTSDIQEIMSLQLRSYKTGWIILLHPCHQPQSLCFCDLAKDQIIVVKERTIIRLKLSRLTGSRLRSFYCIWPSLFH